MSGRNFRRTAILALALSVGVSAVARAEAAQARSRTGFVIQAELSLRTLLQNMMDIFLAVTKGDPPPPNNPGGSPPPGQTGQEGSGACPNGGGPRPGPAQ